MTFRNQTTGNSRSIMDLFFCIEQFAANMEDSFNAIQNNFTTFRARLGELRRRHLIDAEGPPLSKSQLVKKKAQAKNVRTKRRQDSSEATQQVKLLFNEDLTVVTINQEKELSQVNRPPQDSIDFFSIPTETFELEIGDIMLDEDDKGAQKESLWHEFYEAEKTRLRQLDPKASNSDIAKFTEVQWNSMSELEKADWKNNNVKIKENKSSNKKGSTLQGFVKDSRYEARFSDFLFKKTNRAQETPNTQQIQSYKQIQPSKQEELVSASQLISVLQSSRQQPLEERVREQVKLKRVFDTFEL